MRAGFPSPADDFTVRPIDLTAELITHPQATFLVRVAGHSMHDAGIFDGDTLIVDRAIAPRHGHVVVAVLDDGFTVKYLDTRSQPARLHAANTAFANWQPAKGQAIEIWGVVTASIKRFVK